MRVYHTLYATKHKKKQRDFPKDNRRNKCCTSVAFIKTFLSLKKRGNIFFKNNFNQYHFEINWPHPLFIVYLHKTHCVHDGINAEVNILKCIFMKIRIWLFKVFHDHSV